MKRFERGLIVLIAAVVVGGVAALLTLAFSSVPNSESIFHSCHISGITSTTFVTRSGNGSLSVTSAGWRLCSASVDRWPLTALLGGAAIGGVTAFFVLRRRRPPSPV